MLFSMNSEKKLYIFSLQCKEKWKEKETFSFTARHLLLFSSQCSPTSPFSIKWIKFSSEHNKNVHVCECPTNNKRLNNARDCKRMDFHIPAIVVCCKECEVANEKWKADEISNKIKGEKLFLFTSTYYILYKALDFVLWCCWNPIMSYLLLRMECFCV
jgi:hypothetical protein